MADFLENLKTIGSFAGWGSLFYLIFKDIINKKRKPKLKIFFNPSKDNKIYTNSFTNSLVNISGSSMTSQSVSSISNTEWLRKFSTVHVKNKGKETAKRCVAIMRIIGKPALNLILEDTFSLHCKLSLKIDPYLSEKLTHHII